MAFVKVVKNKAYFRRFQVKFRRRREAKTDYYARKRLIIQDKNKYKTPKYRLVVRVTKRDIIAQIIAADLNHDAVIASAYAHELQRYGVKLGLTNYAAAYATGLLLARRVNTKFNLSYEGKTDVDGENYSVAENVEDEEAPQPFKALLDVGLARTTTGARIFGVLKGAVDGGLDVPHNDHRFPGSKREAEWTADPETHKKYIFAGHVAEWMNNLKEQDEEAYKRQFSRYIKAGLTAEKLEGVYQKAHAAIRKDPNAKRGDLELGYFGVRKTKKPATVEKKSFKKFTKLSLTQRRSRISQKVKAIHKAVAASQ